MIETNVAAPLTTEQEQQVTTPDELWSDSFALGVAKSDFERAQSYRTQNHDVRWQNADMLYLGYVAPKFWEGTRIPRANISVFTAYEQVEAMVPRVMQALFGDNPWFEALPIGSTPAYAAECARDVILAQMTDCRLVKGSGSIKKVVEAGVRSFLIYGNGIWQLSWHYQQDHVKKFLPHWTPEVRIINHPLMGRVPFPTGRMIPNVQEMDVIEEQNRPILENISIKDFYIDPNCPTPDPNDGRYTCRRDLVPVDFFADLRDNDEFTIPSDTDLIELSHQKPGAYGDQTKSLQESARYVSYQPMIDQTADPGGKRIELIRYRTNERDVWMLNRSTVIYNKPNNYGRMLQYNVCYTNLSDRFYGMAMTDVTEGEQRLQEGVINGRVDELALNIHPERTIKRGSESSPYKFRKRPGLITFADNPDKDVVDKFTNNVTQQAFAEIAASDMRVQKITGMNDLVSGGQNPVARSATGAGLQGQATFARSQYLVEKVETDFFEQMLSDCHMLNNYHLDPRQKIEAVNGKQIDPMAIFGANVKFEMRAGSRMASKQALLQNLQWIMQSAMNPQLLQQLTMQGLTIDFTEIFQIIADATGYARKADLVRPLTPQEQQALKAARENPQSMELMMQRERMAAMEKMQQDKGELGIAGEVIKGLLSHKTEEMKAESKDDSKSKD